MLGGKNDVVIALSSPQFHFMEVTLAPDVVGIVTPLMDTDKLFTEGVKSWIVGLVSLPPNRLDIVHAVSMPALMS